MKHSWVLNSLQILLVFVLLTGCGGAAEKTSLPPAVTPATAASATPPPTATATPLLPTATATSLPPTATVPPLPPTATLTATSAPSASTIEYKNPKNYRVEYIVTVSNKGYTPSKLMIYQPRPIEWDSQKNVTVEEVTPAPLKSGVDPDHGNGMYYWLIKSAPKSGASMQFKIQFTLTAYETLSTVDPDKIQPYNQDSPLYKLYTRSERFIESTNPQIVALADKIADGETNPYRLARKFYDYVMDNSKYKLLGKGLVGANYLLTNGEGECGDYSSLFIALSRAKGIPARSIVGYWAISGLNQTHVWAEFYIENVGWIPVDATVGQSRKADYYFGNMDNQRIVLNKGFNIRLEPAGPDNYEAALLQVPLWWFWGSGDASKMSLERTSWKVTSIP